MRALDLTDQAFGRLTVLGFAGNVRGVRNWACACACGGITRVTIGNLRNGHTTSCGCFGRNNGGHRTHGDTVGRQRPGEYRSWTMMLNRCTNERAGNFSYYGGRGIVVCERWLIYANFLADMGRKPTPDHSIDRKDPNGNYEPGNCRWATRQEQAENQRTRRNAVLVAIDGVTRPVAEWCRAFGTSKNTAYGRILRGWEPADAVRGKRSQ